MKKWEFPKKRWNPVTEILSRLSKGDKNMAKKLLAMVLGLTMMIGAAGCSAVDTGSG